MSVKSVSFYNFKIPYLNAYTLCKIFCVFVNFYVYCQFQAIPRSCGHGKRRDDKYRNKSVENEVMKLNVDLNETLF